MAPLETTATILSPGQADEPQAVLLGSGVILVSWDVPQAVHASAALSAAQGHSVAPAASLRLSRTDGGTRLLWATRCPESGPLHITLSTGALGSKTSLAIQPDTVIPVAGSDNLVQGLDEQACETLISTLLNVWSGLFRLRRDGMFIECLLGLMRQPASTSEAATIVARAVGDIVLLQAALPPRFGEIDAIYCVGRDGLRRLPGRPRRGPLGGGREMVHLLTSGKYLAGREAFVVFAGSEGLQVQSLAKSEPQPLPLTRWLREQTKRAPGLREHLLIGLSDHASFGKAAALEAQLSVPLKPQRVGANTSGLAAEITCAISTPAGTLLAGWLRDPLNLVAGIAAVVSDGTIHDLTSALHRYPIVVEGPNAGRVSGTGFATLAPSVGGDAPILQPRFRLLLKSGAFHPLVPTPQPADPAEARAVALRAVPPQHVNDKLLSEVLAPVIADLHAKTQTHIGQPHVRVIGTLIARPKASVVIPLYKVLDFLRFQIAAFATDPWFRKHAELIYVLDTPEQATEVDHLLTGLHLVYGLPMTLAIMDRNSGYARACNAGAAASRGEILALVNSDVIPTAPGWIEKLAERLDNRRRVGAVGPKLLFEDGSLQHAGMHFARDHRGRWLNHHYFKGMPRHYAPATEERFVPAVTGACLVMPRALFEKVGGFSDDYVIGDYEDSDLCLKIAAAGRKISYVPDVELYHLERKSMSLNPEYMKGIAWQYNCALHTSRWGDMIASVMNTYTRPGRPRSKAA
ncbi:glycosyltransferase family 2 protein [Microvirga alba]|uniref:Glycosyltransferase n=1 Tax=Microvirga alba TaxID=2791025 RepID=A0A931BPW6_9HYPH|nr:glycosyltransferase family 2 protein [Microvirga alba]MBF9233878.1 glycosyltransferase [Microvirga alba]